MKKDLLYLKEELLKKGLFSYAKEVDLLSKNNFLKTAATPSVKDLQTVFIEEIFDRLLDRLELDGVSKAEIEPALLSFAASKKAVLGVIEDGIPKTEPVKKINNLLECGSSMWGMGSYVVSNPFWDNNEKKFHPIGNKKETHTKYFCKGSPGSGKHLGVYLTSGKPTVTKKLASNAFPGGLIAFGSGSLADKGQISFIIYHYLDDGGNLYISIDDVKILKAPKLKKYEYADIVSGDINLSYGSESKTSVYQDDACGDGFQLKKNSIYQYKKQLIEPMLKLLYERGFYKEAGMGETHYKQDVKDLLADKNKIDKDTLDVINHAKSLFDNSATRSDAGPDEFNPYLSIYDFDTATLPHCSELDNGHIKDIEAFLASDPPGSDPDPTDPTVPTVPGVVIPKKKTNPNPPYGSGSPRWYDEI